MIIEDAAKAAVKMQSDNLLMLIGPKKRTLVRVSRGSGDNLLTDDINEGYIDYVDWSSYKIGLEACDPDMSEDDGGMVLLKECYEDADAEDLIRQLVREVLDGGEAEKCSVFCAESR